MSFIKNRVLSGVSMTVLLSLMAFAFSSSAIAMEAKVFAIGDFVPSSSGGCGGNDIGHWPVMVDKWYDHMAVHGHLKDGQYTNGNMTIRRFADPDKFTGGQDHIYADDADAFMIATHGGDNGDHWVGTMRYPWSGHCGLDAGGFPDGNDMNVGEIDAEFIHLSSCYSADDDNIWNVYTSMRDSVDLGSYAHQWDGFHGIMWIGSGFDNDYKEFAHDAHYIAMSRSWVNNMYDSTVDCAGYDPWNWFGTCQEQCPVAFSVGTSGNNALSRLNYERYNNVWSDVTWSNFGGRAIRYIVGCNSVGEGSFSP
jgi:hypothetical protein